VRITVRDPASARLLAEIGVRSPYIEVTADPAFALTPASDDAVDSLMAAESLPQDRPLLGVALRPWAAAGFWPLDRYARLLAALERSSGARVVLLPMQIPGDVTFAEAVARETGEPGRFPIVRRAYAPSVLLGLAARMQAVVAMRLHALIFAAHAGVPPFALAYDPKVQSLMCDLGLDRDLADWRDFDPNDVAEHVCAALADRASRAAALRARQAELEARALRNADCALELFS
jgi:polysaccharide pyruvyl transferase WcaK-like protein